MVAVPPVSETVVGAMSAPLLLLDGARDRDALVDGLRAFLRSLAKPETANISAKSLEMRLERLAKQALLLA